MRTRNIGSIKQSVSYAEIEAKTKEIHQEISHSASTNYEQAIIYCTIFRNVDKDNVLCPSNNI